MRMCPAWTTFCLPLAAGVPQARGGTLPPAQHDALVSI